MKQINKIFLIVLANIIAVYIHWQLFESPYPLMAGISLFLHFYIIIYSIKKTQQNENNN